MIEAQIKVLNNFSLNEKDTKGRRIFSRSEEIDSRLMERTDYAVSLAKKQFKSKYPDIIFKVVDINLGEHSDGSYHYEGKAIDGFYYDRKLKIILPLSLQFYLFQLAGFKGIGVYPEHQQPKVHGDIREQDGVSVWYGYYVMEGLKRIQLYEYDRLKIAKVLCIM